MDSAEKRAMIETIRAFPQELERLLSGLTEEQIEAHNEEGGWSVRQIVHHLADSHMNSLIRLKLILTLDRPTLQGYPQDAWALLPDTAGVPLEASLQILRGLHARWAAVWDAMPPDAWTRTGLHTENGEVTPEQMLHIYARHCRDHLAQMKAAVDANLLQR